MSEDKSKKDVVEENIKLKWQLGEVATETAEVIYDSVNEKQYNANQALIHILNELEEIKKTLTSS